MAEGLEFQMEARVFDGVRENLRVENNSEKELVLEGRSLVLQREKSSQDFLGKGEDIATEEAKPELEKLKQGLRVTEHYLSGRIESNEGEKKEKLLLKEKGRSLAL